MRLLLDENLPGWLAADLRKLGLDAVDVREAAGPGLSDDDVYRMSLRSRRHLISANYKDFGNPLRYPPTKHCGIVVVRMPKCSIQTVAENLRHFLSAVKPAYLARCLIVLEPTRARRRRLT